MFGKQKDEQQDGEQKDKVRLAWYEKSLVPSLNEKVLEQKQASAEIKDAQKDLAERDKALYARTAQYKAQWLKNGIIQFKNERMAILKRQIGAQVEFIIAFDDLTGEGYQLKAIDEGRSVDGGIGAGGTTSYYYFQKGL
jgi:hypothetical protein